MPAEPRPDVDDFTVAAEIFRLLADPTRVGLLFALAHAGGGFDAVAGDGELSVTDLAAAVDRRQTAVSQHLARLRMARLVTTRKLGTQVLYRLANDHVRALVLDAIGHAEHLGPGVPAHHLEQG